MTDIIYFPFFMKRKYLHKSLFKEKKILKAFLNSERSDLMRCIFQLEEQNLQFKLNWLIQVNMKIKGWHFKKCLCSQTESTQVCWENNALKFYCDILADIWKAFYQQSFVFLLTWKEGTLETILTHCGTFIFCSSQLMTSNWLIMKSSLFYPRNYVKINRVKLCALDFFFNGSILFLDKGG